MGRGAISFNKCFDRCVTTDRVAVAWILRPMVRVPVWGKDLVCFSVNPEANWIRYIFWSKHSNGFFFVVGYSLIKAKAEDKAGWRNQGQSDGTSCDFIRVAPTQDFITSINSPLFINHIIKSLFHDVPNINEVTVFWAY